MVHVSGQIIIIHKPEIRPFGMIPLINHDSSEVVIIYPDVWIIYLFIFSISMLHVMGYDGLSQCFLLVWLINRKSMRAVFCGQRASGNFHGFV
jgi:hypothetical protein